MAPNPGDGLVRRHQRGAIAESEPHAKWSSTRVTSWWVNSDPVSRIARRSQPSAHRGAAKLSRPPVRWKPDEDQETEGADARMRHLHATAGNGMGRVRRPEHSTLAGSACEGSYSTRASLPPVGPEPPKGTLGRFRGRRIRLLLTVTPARARQLRGHECLAVSASLALHGSPTSPEPMDQRVSPCGPPE